MLQKVGWVCSQNREKFLSELVSEPVGRRMGKRGWGQVRNTLNNMRSLNFIGTREPLKVFKHKKGLVRALLHVDKPGQKMGMACN